MKKYLFAAIIVLAVLLRFYKLGSVPPSPDWDEAALGYNAYSILKTGRDEYGTFLPRTLRSFDDYKPPLYAYLTVPSVAVFGLNVHAVRIPSAVMGTLAVIGTYVMVLELVKHVTPGAFRKMLTGTDGRRFALLSAFLLAVSPWHLQFSRIAFEANTGVTLNIWGIYAFLRGLRSRWWMVASAAIFGLSLYAYHSERVFVPLLVLTLAVLFRKELFSDRTKVVAGILAGLLVVAPLLPVVLDKTSMTRLRGTSSLSDQTGLLMRSVDKLKSDLDQGNKTGLIFDNRRIVYARTLLDGYLSHYSLRWLFLTGDNDRHHAPDNGLMYLWELPFLLAGIFAVWRQRQRISRLLVAWLLIAPVAASPTSETPHAIRSLVAVPAVQLFTAAGILYVGYLYSRLTRAKAIRYAAGILVAGYGIFAVLNATNYFHMYYAHMNREYAQFWQYGYEQAVRYAQKHYDRYDRIVVSTELEQPHMFFLFYTGYDPVQYLKDGGTASGGFAEIRNRFGKYEFRPIPDWSREIHDGSVLYIGHPKEIPPSAQPVNYPDSREAMRISE